ncbi:hypothetical protein NKJ46_17040 [Mesorhizobium sp. M0166]|uniref:hypothetical protein n=2 Tax=unclassified Mesorhizobium TaxID=325217 RepID=UPI00333BE657
MVEIDKARQEVVAEVVRRWITSEVIRNYLRAMLNLPVEQELPAEQKHLLQELDRADKEWLHGAPLVLPAGPCKDRGSRFDAQGQQR